MIIHQPTKSVVLKVRDPQRILTAFPGLSRSINANEGNVQIKHTFATTLALNTLGLHRVTSPILYQYQWPGKYTPFDHQRPMADFHARNTKALNLSEMGCVAGETQIETSEGAIPIARLTGQSARVRLYTGGYAEATCFLKGRDKLYRIGFASGRSITVTQKHLFLTLQGWVFCADLAVGSQLPVFDGALPASISALDPSMYPQDVPRWSDRERGCQDYWRILSCDAPPLWGVDNGQALPPSLVDVPRQSLPWSQMDVLDTTHRYSFRSDDGPRSMLHCSDRFDLLDTQYPRAEYATTLVDNQARTFERYLQPSSLQRSALQDQGSPFYNLPCAALSSFPLDTVTHITDMGMDVYYDLAVPGAQHYIAHGLCHHNTGKTYATLWAADYLMSIGEVHKALILAPLSILELIWKQDIFDILMHRSAVVTHGTRDYRINALSMDVDFYIANHDMIAHKEVATLVRKRKDIDLIIIDEASFFRNSRNLTYKFLAWATENKKRVWLLTGTPCPNLPTDAWALARLVCPDRVPKFFGAFQRKTMVQVSQYKWRAVRGAEQIVFDALQPAWRVTKKDCISLPPLTVVNHRVQLTAEQQKHYKRMRDSMILQHKTTTVTAVNAADALLKLRQICCGAYKNGDDTYETIDYSTRLNELINVISQASAKVLVVIPFKGITRALEPEVAKHYSVAVLNGDVSPKERTRIIHAFKSGPDPRVLLCHPQIMSHGLNLTEADVTIFYAPIYSHDQYSQVIERFNRTGQKNKMTIIRIGATSLEWDIYSLLDNRALNQDNILKLYERVVACSPTMASSSVTGLGEIK